MPFATVEFGQIVEVIWVSLLAGVVVTGLFALVIHGSARAADCRRTGSGPAAAYATLAAVALVGFLAVAVFGITVILNKS